MTLNDARNMLMESVSDEEIELQLEWVMATIRAAERIRRAEMNVMIRHHLF